ncbi:MAG: hypothetical protein IJD39_00235 [Clostridia bacterium]|nr:hypothetical protein [Clostridia bacterium]
MAKNAKIHKSMSARSKGFIGLVLLLAITVIVSFLSVSGVHYGEDGVMQLLPWVPVSSKNWPESLPLSRALGGGEYVMLYASVAEGENLEEELAASKKSVEARIAALGETDAKVTVEGNALRVELPEMNDEALHSWIEFVSMPGKFDLQNVSGETVFSAPFAKTSVAPNSANNAYEMTIEFSKEDTQALNEAVAANGALFNAFCDGSVVAYYVSVENGKVVMNMGQDLNTASNVAVLCLNPVTVSLSYTHDGESEGEVAATSGAFLSIVLIACAALLVAGAIYLIGKGKLTGVSAIITVWCAVMLECFFYATLVRSTVTLINLLMLVVGLVLALYAAALRTKEISKLIGEGNTPKSANKLGMRTAAKKVWLAHGVLLVLSLIMMIFGFSKVAGYALCCGVTASAFVTPVMRLFQASFIAMTGKAASFGKVK